MGLQLSHTVDGRNPTPPSIWCKISSIHRIIGGLKWSQPSNGEDHQVFAGKQMNCWVVVFDALFHRASGKGSQLLDW